MVKFKSILLQKFGGIGSTENYEIDENVLNRLGLGPYMWCLSTFAVLLTK